MKHLLKILTLFATVFMGISLVGCGGGGGGSTTPLIVTGTASEGALITGQTVKLKDANGKSAADVTTGATNGVYTIDVTNLTPPFLLTVTGTSGKYVSLAQADGKANINPITTMVVALAAGNSDVSTLFTDLTPVQLAGIKANYTAKSGLVTTSLQSVLTSGVKAEDYFTGTVTSGTGMDALFDTYQIAIQSTEGITVKTKGDTAVTVLSIPAATVIASSTGPLPSINIAPVANAGPTQSVAVDAVVTLDGSASSDANNDTLTYGWSLTSKPSNSNASLLNATTVNPTFTADQPGPYVISLIVNDGVLSSAASTVMITTAPVANAGPAQSVVENAVVTLDGSASRHANNDTLTYGWSLTSKPSNSNASLLNATTVSPSFTADKIGIYVISLIVNNGVLSSTASTVTITAASANTAPVANAGPAQSVVVGAVVTLDGSASSDANSGDTLTYSWSLTSGPGSSVTLSSTTAAKPTFTAGLTGTYVFTLVVNDGKLNSTAPTVSITSIANQGSVSITW